MISLFIQLINVLTLSIDMEAIENISVLVLMSTYNGELFLKEQLESILNQELVYTILLIRDDGSIDATKKIIDEYVIKCPNRIIFVEGDNVGFAMSFTELLRLAHEKYNDFEYYAFADQDDVWEPKKLYASTLLLKDQLGDLPVSYCSNTTLVDKDLNFIGYTWKDTDVLITKPRSLIQNFATGCTMVFNKKAVELYITHLPIEVERHDFLMFQICVFLGKIVYDKNSYIKYRQHGKNQIGRPGFWGRIKNRMKGRYKTHVLENQNKYFLEAYKDLLSVKDIGLLSKVVFYRTDFFYRLSLLFDSRIRYTSMEANAFFILKIILGYV